MKRITLAALILPLAIVLGLVVTLVAIAGSLGPEVATHWGTDGTPDGFTSTSNLPWLAGGLMAIVVLPLALLISRTKASIIAPRGLAALPAALAAFIAALLLTSLLPQIDLDEQSVRTFDAPWWMVPSAFAAGAIAGTLAAVIAGRPATPPSTQSPASPSATRFPLDTNHVASWSGQTANGRVLLAVAAITFTGFAISAAVTTWFLLIPATAMALIILGSTQFSVSAGPGGVRVVGIAGFPTVSVPLDQIESVEAGSVKALSFGGWGLRKSLSGNDAVLTRSGPSLVVTRTDGAVLHITIDDPAIPASIMASLLDRRA